MKHFLSIFTGEDPGEEVFRADIGERLPIDVQVVVLQAIKSVADPKPPRKRRSDAGVSKNP